MITRTNRRPVAQLYIQRRSAAPSLLSLAVPGEDQRPIVQCEDDAKPESKDTNPVQKMPQEEERDLFIPAMVGIAIAGYCATAAIAWIEYNFDF